MPRATNSPASRSRRKKFLDQASGFRGGRSKLYRTARETVQKGLAYAYRDRRVKKRTFRALWITRIGAAAKLAGTSYSKLVNGLMKSKIELNRKMLAEMAVTDPKGFQKVVELTNVTS